MLAATQTQVELCCLLYHNLNLNEFYQNFLFVVPVAVTKRKSKSTIMGTWKEAKKDAKNKIRMPLLREREGNEEPRGGSTEAEEEDKEEELGSTGQTNHLSGSQTGLVSLSP